MTQPSVTIVGDVHVQQFRPVKWTRASVHGEDIVVYGLDESMESRRTESPGGAAFLAHLLHRAGVHIQALLPVPEQWKKILLRDLPDDRVMQLAAPEWPNREEGFYTLDREAQQWKLKCRAVDHHPFRSGAPATPLEPTSMLVVDDYLRGAITSELLAAAMTCGPDRIVLSPQRRNSDAYAPLFRSGAEVIVVCSEREALSWSGIERAPVRLPDGNPSDHENLIKLLLTRLMAAFPAARHFIVNMVGPPLRSLHLRRLVGAGEPHNVALIEPVRGSEPTPGESVPGVETFYLAALVQALNSNVPTADAAAQAVSMCALYASRGVEDSGAHFGALEELPPDGPARQAVPAWLLSIGPQERVVALDDDFLRQAQFEGRLRLDSSILRDYYAPDDVEQQIASLLKALAAYCDKSNRRPFNLLLEADPGSGKSYFASCLSRHLDRMAVERGGPSGQFPLEEKNLSLAAGLPHVDLALRDLYEVIRDHRAVGHVPVVLVDEFDTLTKARKDADDVDDMDRLIAQMLAPLADGAFAVDARVHRLGSFVLLLAVSTREFIQRLDLQRGKWKDFASRIDVRLHLHVNQNEDARRKSNVNVAVAMLRKHFGSSARRVQLAVLDALSRAEFTGNNRSIDQLIMMSSRPAAGLFTTDNLPDEELRKRLAPHIDIRTATDRYGTSFVEI